MVREQDDDVTVGVLQLDVVDQGAGVGTRHDERGLPDDAVGDLLGPLDQLVGEDREAVDVLVGHGDLGLLGIFAVVEVAERVDALAVPVLEPDEVAILQRLFPALPDIHIYTEELRRITRHSNDLLFRIVEDLCDAYESGVSHSWSATALQTQCGEFLDQLVLERNRFIARHQRVLMDVLERGGLVAAQA